MPFVAVGEADRKIGARSGEAQRMERAGVQPFGAAAQRRIVRRPRRDGIVHVDPRSGEDRIGKLRHRHVFVLAGEHLAGPGRVRIGDDVPVDVEARDLLQRRLVGDRVGLVGARHLRRVLLGEQHRIVAGDRKPRRVSGEGLGHALVEPARGTVEALVAAVAVAGERQFLVGEERRHQTGAGPVGVLGDAADQRQGCDRRGHHQVLSRLQLQADAHGDLGQAVELHRVDRCGEIARIGVHRIAFAGWFTMGPT